MIAAGISTIKGMSSNCRGKPPIVVATVVKTKSTAKTTPYEIALLTNQMRSTFGSGFSGIEIYFRLFESVAFYKRLTLNVFPSRSWPDSQPFRNHRTR